MFAVVLALLVGVGMCVCGVCAIVGFYDLLTDLCMLVCGCYFWFDWLSLWWDWMV